MKQKDVTLIIVIAFISAVFSFFASNLLFAPPKDRQEKVEIVDQITADFQKPDPKYFNSNAVNPTQLIRIGDSNNSSPFNKTP